MQTIEIPTPVMTVSVESGPWRTQGMVPLAHWEGVLSVMGHPVLRRTYLDRDDAVNYPDVAAEYADTASCLEDAEEKFGLLVAETIKNKIFSAFSPS